MPHVLYQGRHWRLTFTDRDCVISSCWSVPSDDAGLALLFARARHKLSVKSSSRVPITMNDDALAHTLPAKDL